MDTEKMQEHYTKAEGRVDRALDKVNRGLIVVIGWVAKWRESPWSAAIALVVLSALAVMAAAGAVGLVLLLWWLL